MASAKLSIDPTVFDMGTQTMWLATRWRKGAESLVTALFLLVLALPATARDTAPAPTRTVLVFGDSLSAAFGLATQQGWVHLLGRRLATDYPQWQAVNASISGETTAGGASRIDAALQLHAPDLVLIELGANDALRGLPIELAGANLERMILASQAAGARVLLIGIRVPPNYGPDYAEALRLMYASLAEKHDTALLPFLLEPIAAERGAFLPDNLHPTAEAQPRVLEHVWSALEPLLATELAASRP
jgi:acyl-CoA thioesterase-1